eukprot:435513-Pelagomonas_calceolata.AAC.2
MNKDKISLAALKGTENIHQEKLGVGRIGQWLDPFSVLTGCVLRQVKTGYRPQCFRSAALVVRHSDVTLPVLPCSNTGMLPLLAESKMLQLSCPYWLQAIHPYVLLTMPLLPAADLFLSSGNLGIRLGLQQAIHPYVLLTMPLLPADLFLSSGNLGKSLGKESMRPRLQALACKKTQKNVGSQVAEGNARNSKLDKHDAQKTSNLLVSTAFISTLELKESFHGSSQAGSCTT